MIIQPVTRKRLWKPPIGSTVKRSHPMAKAIRACWLFNEGGGALLHDIGPRQATATQAGTVSPSTWISTPYGYGFDFASNLRYDTAATWESQFLNAWSISVLLRSPLSVASDRLVTIHDSGINYRYLFQTKNTSAIQFGGYGSSYPYTSTGVLTANKWHHVVCVAQPGQTDIYVDTVNVKSVSDVYYGTSADGPLSINGLRASGTWYYGRSDFAHVMMWDRALTAEDVMWLYVDPYDHIDPPLSRRYIVVGTGGGGGTTAFEGTVTAGSCAITGATPTLTANRSFAESAIAGAASLVGETPVLTTGTASPFEGTVAAGSSGIVGATPTLTANRAFAGVVSAGSCGVVGASPVLTTGSSIPFAGVASAGSCGISGATPSLVANRAFAGTATAGSSSLSGSTPTLTANRSFAETSLVGTAAIVGCTPVLTTGISGVFEGVVTAGSCGLTGAMPTLTADREFVGAATAGTAGIVGATPVLTTGAEVPFAGIVTAGSCALAGGDPGLAAGFAGVPGAGVLQPVGATPTLLANRAVVAVVSPGSCGLEGCEPRVSWGIRTIVYVDFVFDLNREIDFAFDTEREIDFVF